MSLNNNIFKLSNNQDIDCKYINQLCTQATICEKDPDNNIVKYFGSKDVFQWESFIYLQFVTCDIFPLTTSCNGKLIHYTKNMKTFRNTLKRFRKNYSFIFNELFSFLNNMKSLHFLHGNLHIDNIFVEEHPKLKFSVIDFSNSFVLALSKVKSPSYKRSSFVKEYESDVKWKYIVYWDFITIYISIKLFMIKDVTALTALEIAIQTYVPKSILSECINFWLKEKKRQRLEKALQ